LGNLDANKLNLLSTSKISLLTTVQISALSIGALKNISSNFIANLSTTQISALSNEQITSMHGAAKSVVSDKIKEIQKTATSSTAYSFNGTNFVYTPNLEGIVSGSDARTYNIWIRLPTPLNGYGTLIGQGTLSSYQRSAIVITNPWAGYNNGSGAYALAFSFQVGEVWSPKFDINDTNWHMITATFDKNAVGLGVKFYLDGTDLVNPVANVVNGFNKNSVNTINSSNSVTIGGESYDGSTLSASTGFIGEIRNANAWSGALTASEVADIYNSIALPSNGLFFSKN
jgi:hypothetical protein